MKKTTQSRHLMDILAAVNDPRKQKGKRHPLQASLALSLIAILRLTGYTHISKTTRYLAAKPKQALKLLTDTF